MKKKRVRKRITLTPKAQELMVVLKRHTNMSEAQMIENGLQALAIQALQLMVEHIVEKENEDTSSSN